MWWHEQVSEESHFVITVIPTSSEAQERERITVPRVCVCTVSFTSLPRRRLAVWLPVVFALKWSRRCRMSRTSVWKLKRGVCVCYHYLWLLGAGSSRPRAALGSVRSSPRGRRWLGAGREPRLSEDALSLGGGNLQGVSATVQGCA